MTILRVKLDKTPTILKDAEVAKIEKQWLDSVTVLEDALLRGQVTGDHAIAEPRQIYKLADKKLKAKTLSGPDRDKLLARRKRSYDLTTELKKLTRF